MSVTRYSQCPLCEQIVPVEASKVVLKSGKILHEECAKEISEGYFKQVMQLKSKNKNRKPQKKKEKPKNDRQANTGA